MKRFKMWGLGVASLTVAVVVTGCGETSNVVGDVPEAGAGGSRPNAGSSSGGSASNGGASPVGGTSNAGTTSSAGTSSAGASQGGSGNGGTSAGGTGMGGSDPGKCTELSGNWISCENGVVHRTAPGKCETKLPTADVLEPLDPQLDECTRDSECTQKPNGYCSVFFPGFSDIKQHNFCAYGCTQDSECDPGSVCQCGSTIGTCQSARGCKSDQDCQGALCSNYASCPGAPVDDFACETPNDTCKTDADCRAHADGKQFCTVGQSGSRECEGVVCQA